MNTESANMTTAYETMLKFEAAFAAWVASRVHAADLRAQGRKPRNAVKRARARLEAACRDAGVECPV